MVNLNSCNELVDELGRQGWSCVLVAENGRRCCTFVKGDAEHKVIATKFEEAICESFLRVLGLWELPDTNKNSLRSYSECGDLFTPFRITMNAQLRELLTRIPCSPETDELQNVLEKQDEMQRAELMELRRENRLLAMLASESPEFYNPLHAMEAVTLRDAILKQNAEPPHGRT